MKTQNIWIASLAIAAIGSVGYLFAASSFTPDDEPTNYISGLAVTNNNLTSGDEYVFKTDFEKFGWQGNVYGYAINATGGFTGSEAWTDNGLAPLLDSDAKVIADRIIVTLKDDGTKVPFIATAGGISTTQLGTLAVTGATTTQVLDFIRGDRTNEKTSANTTRPFRERQSRLGDIIHSRPFYSKLGSVPVLFVGANDGMLHAFNVSTPTSATPIPPNGGEEIWAYIPSMLIPKLKNLTADPYVHNYYVDGGLTVGDAEISGTASRVLVSGLGAGGKGLFALNVTNPVAVSAADAANKILWEITPTTIKNVATTATTGYSNLGNTYGTPVLAKINTGAYAVIVGNGYNSGTRSSLYIINAATGAKIKEIVTSGATNGGLSSPRCLDSNSDGIIDYCYAGDIDGKLWKFNLTAATVASWTSSELSTAGSANIGGTLVTQAANTQPITMAPSLVAHPFGGYMVIFGTGSAFTQTERDSTATHYMYGMWDSPTTPAGTALLVQTLAEKNYVSGSTTRRVRIVTSTEEPKWGAVDTVTDPTDSAAKHHKGWIVAMPVGGERILGDEIFTDSGRVLFNATNPTATGRDATATAPAVRGENWLMELNAISGGTLNIPFLNMNTDGVVNADDRVKYVTGDTIPTGQAIGRNNLTKAGVVVGKFISNGISSHPTLVELATLFTTIFSENPDITPVPSTPAVPATEPGVAGGHFDVDIYYPIFGRSSKLHTHKYDDKYDATGVNMLNAGNAGFNLSNAITSTSTPFKVLIQNQYLNPAVTLAIGPNTDGSTGAAAYKSVKTYGEQAKETVAANVLTNAPTYTRANISRLAFNMPVSAFAQRDWWGIAGGSGYVAGDTRVGLHPTKTGCVKSDSGNKLFQAVIPPVNGVDGPGTNSTTSGVRHNGAVVIQLIKADTLASEIELNVADRPEYGWRVKSASFETKVLAEYTVFWHHPSGKCYGDVGWTKLVATDTTVAPACTNRCATAAADGSADPSFGEFGTGTGTVGTGGTAGTSPDGEGTVTGGTAGATSAGEQSGTRAQTGRLSWTELYQE